jgi:small subunit ribosomal protein S6
MRTYEVLFILSPQNSEEENTSLVTEFKGVGERLGATLVNEEAWGKRRLAYPISKFNEGTYHLFVFHSDAPLNDLDRRMKNSDRILRHVIVRTDAETRRAIKLAKKNPKKERVRPAPAAAASAPAPVAPAAVEPAPEIIEAAPEAPAAE